MKLENKYCLWNRLCSVGHCFNCNWIFIITCYLWKYHCLKKVNIYKYKHITIYYRMNVLLFFHQFLTYSQSRIKNMLCHFLVCHSLVDHSFTNLCVQAQLETKLNSGLSMHPISHTGGCSPFLSLFFVWVYRKLKTNWCLCRKVKKWQSQVQSQGAKAECSWVYAQGFQLLSLHYHAVV